MDKFKEKVFAISVVVALAVIFIPMLFNSSTEKKVSLAKELPPAPLAKATALPKPKPIETHISLPSVSQGVDNESKMRVHEDQLTLKHEQGVTKPQIPEKKIVQASPTLQAQSKVLEALPKKSIEQPSLNVKPETNLAMSQIKEPTIENQTQIKDSVALAQADPTQDRMEAKAKEKVVPTVPALKTESAQESSQKSPSKNEETASADWHPWIHNTTEEPNVHDENTDENADERGKKSAKKTISHEKQTGHGWAVQLGSFAVPEHAQVLVHKLKNAGYPAFTRYSENSDRSLTLVFVGPNLRKEDAAKLVKTLESKFKLKGILVRYLPLREMKENES